MLFIEPVYNTFPSLINLAFKLFIISPFVTFEPATLPIFDTLKIVWTSAEPTTSSFTSGFNNHDNELFTKYKTS